MDGILVVDLPLEESTELRQYTDRSGIDFISLIAPTTSTDRIRRISTDATGFLYYISITGVTGTARPQVADIKRDAERIRKITALPLAVDFGMSTRQQAREIAPYVDGIVIGSAFVRLIEENRYRADMIPVSFLIMSRRSRDQLKHLLCCNNHHAPSLPRVFPNTTAIPTYPWKF